MSKETDVLMKLQIGGENRVPYDILLQFAHCLHNMPSKYGNQKNLGERSMRVLLIAEAGLEFSKDCLVTAMTVGIGTG